MGKNGFGKSLKGAGALDLGEVAIENLTTGSVILNGAQLTGVGDGSQLNNIVVNNSTIDNTVIGENGEEDAFFANVRVFERFTLTGSNPSSGIVWEPSQNALILRNATLETGSVDAPLNLGSDVVYKGVYADSLEHLVFDDAHKLQVVSTRVTTTFISLEGVNDRTYRAALGTGRYDGQTKKIVLTSVVNECMVTIEYNTDYILELDYPTQHATLTWNEALQEWEHTAIGCYSSHKTFADT